MGIGRLGRIEGTLREVVGHDSAVKHPLPAFVRRNSREQKRQKVQQVTGEIPVVSRHDQAANGVSVHELVRFVLQPLGVDWFVDETRILFQHGGKDMVFALMPFPPTAPIRFLQKVVLPKLRVCAEVIVP